jgi:hypothetical protein
MATDDLTAKQHKAIAVLLAEPTIKAAAAALGVGERTIHTWLGDPTFDEAYRKARRDAVRQAVAQLQRSASGAAATLTTIAESPAAKGSDRVAAARAILDYAIRGVELEDLEARIAALEAHHAGNT